MKILITILFLILTSCSGYTAASLSTNIISVAATGKTNADHAVSMLLQKDCQIFRVIRKEQICMLND
jgi:hypothetical protein